MENGDFKIQLSLSEYQTQTLLNLVLTEIYVANITLKQPLRVGSPPSGSCSA